MRWKGSVRQSCICLIFCTIIASSFAQGRRWSVRKTGQYGRKVDSAVSQELQLPTKQFRLHEPLLQTAETRRYHQFVSVRKPSQSLELPRTITTSSDQEAQETGDDGYAYAPPDEPNNSYKYKRPAPVAAADSNPDHFDDSTSPPPQHHNPSVPDVVAGPGDAIVKPLAGEYEEQIDSENVRRPPSASSPQISAAHSDSCTDDNDPNCWQHGYSGVISGEAGVDYPILSEIVPTDFNCDDQQYSGYYADTDDRARCQVFHICLKRNAHRRTQQWSFLCPNGTVYSQMDFVCVWWTEAPECNRDLVRSFYSLNEQLGWDNNTDGSSSSFARNDYRNGNNANLELQSAMSALSPSSDSSSRRGASKNNGFKSPTTYRPSSFSVSSRTTAPSTVRTALPYRVPVKVNGAGRARTRLQEVTQNAIHGDATELNYDTEHEVDESSNFETSLRQQSESRHKTKSGSALHKSESEAYELKGGSDGLQPLIVNRPTGTEAEASTQGGYGDENTQHYVMMRTLQRLPDGTESYADVPVMVPHGTTEPSQGYRYPAPENGYNYPVPEEGLSTSAPAPAYLPPVQSGAYQESGTTENYPTPTVPTEPSLDGENYQVDYQTTTTEPPIVTEQSAGYNYPNPTTTPQSEGYQYPNPTTEQSGYKYPQPTDATTESAGYQYPNPTTEQSAGYQYPSQTDAPPPDESTGYRYPSPTTDQSDGYSYPNPSTTDEPQGYQYPSPTTEQSQAYRQPTTTDATATDQSAGYVYTSPATTDAGYHYPTPNEREQLRESGGYNPTAGTTESPQSTTITNLPSHVDNDDYAVTSNEVTDDYQAETTRANTPKPLYGLPDQTTEKSQDLLSPDSTTSPTTIPPAGSYLPPVTESATEKQIAGEDSSASDSDGDYEDEENEVAGTTGSSGDAAGGYSYHLPTPPSSTPVVLNGANLGTHTQLLIPILREQISARKRLRGTGSNSSSYSYPDNADSEGRLSEILRQIQSGGIEAVDSKGKPIEFSRLKDLLLNSPKGSVQLQGDAADSASSSSSATQLPSLNSSPTVSPRPDELKAVTTEQIINQNNNLQALPSPSEFYLPPNTDNNNAPQVLQLANNVQVTQPGFDIKLPNREYETHTVETNVIDTNNNPNNNLIRSQYSQGDLSNFPQQSSGSGGYQTVSGMGVSVPLALQGQPEFYQSGQQSNGYQQSQGTIVVPNGNYLPPRQQNFEVQSTHSNLVVPLRQPQIFVSNQHSGLSVPPPNGQYLPPRGSSSSTSSILQSSYYNPTASATSHSYVSAPVQLNDNIQLQQSYAQALPPAATRNIKNPLDPKEIKIVPALFVHQHTSVASQKEQEQLERNGNLGNFQSLETAQSSYFPGETVGRFGARNVLAQQLNQIATSNSVYVSNSNNPRQFTRRSNGASAKASDVEKAPPVSTFTLEDARTPEELQQYHHQDLKRFHSENIAKQGSVLDEHEDHSSSGLSTKLNLPEPSTNLRTSSESRSRASDDSRSRTSSNKTSNSSNSPSRYSVDSRILTNSRSQDHFIPISASYGGSGGSGSSTRSRRSGGHSRASRLSAFHDSESESMLLSRFLPEEEGGFGSRL